MLCKEALALKGFGAWIARQNRAQVPFQMVHKVDVKKKIKLGAGRAA